jgi:hypothetical protein
MKETRLDKGDFSGEKEDEIKKKQKVYPTQWHKIPRFFGLYLSAVFRRVYLHMTKCLKMAAEMGRDFSFSSCLEYQLTSFSPYSKTRKEVRVFFLSEKVFLSSL